MTIQQKRDFIRQKAIEANPEIVELKFGCEIEYEGEHGIYIEHIEGFADCFKLDHQFKSTGMCTVTNPKLKIIGRPVRLADVLNALMHTEHTVCIASNERFELFNKAKNEWEQQFKTWYLVQDNLESQSEPTIDFIYSLLK